jgi:hypothetical protein
MENLNQVNDTNYTPIKGDNVFLNDRYGILLDNDFNQVQWVDGEVEILPTWLDFLLSGGIVLVI